MSLRKKILLVQENNLEVLPPLISVIDILQEFHEVVIMTGVRNPKAIEGRWNSERVSFVYVEEEEKFLGTVNLFRKALQLFRMGWRFRKLVREYIVNNRVDLIWVGSVDTALFLKNIFPEESYVAHIFELEENRPSVRVFLKTFYQKAKAVFVPELNRAYLLKAWLELATLPIVIPNRPERLEIMHPPMKQEPRAILYQGVFAPNERNLRGFCVAVESLFPRYELLLIGKHSDYVDVLKKEFRCVRYGGYFVPPEHLNQTRRAYIGIAVYSNTTLNTIYCAPNKIWEYAGCGIPMLINSVPGLSTVLRNGNCAEVVDEESPDEIRNAIKKIEDNYENYASNARRFYAQGNMSDYILGVANFKRNEFVACEKSLDAWHVFCGVFVRGVCERIRGVLMKNPFLKLFLSRF